MSTLRNQMLQVMQQRNYSPRTIKTYLSCLTSLAKHYQTSPDHLSVKQVNDFLHQCIVVRGLSNSLINQMIGALRVLYVYVLKKDWNGIDFPRKGTFSRFQRKVPLGLKDLYHSDDLLLTGSLKDLQSKADFKALLDHLYSKEWVVYTKKTFKSGVQVLRYLGRYTHRIAISNNRIRSFDGLTVTFYWRDYRDNYRNKLMTLETNEFIRRFFLHVLPHGYHKIRYFGLFSLRDRWARLNKILKRLSIPASIEPYKALSIRELILSRTGRDINTCLICHKGEMQAFLNGLNHLPSG